VVVTKSDRTKTQSIHNEDGTTFIPLSQDLYATIYTCNFHLVVRHTWHAHKKVNTIYAETHIRNAEGKRIKVGMHRLILQTDSEFIDHIDGNGLNNRSSNLRPASRVENGRNHKGHKNRKSGLTNKGVYWRADTNVWYAMIKYDGKNRHLGTFKTENDTIEARRRAELLVDPEYFTSLRDMK
jgi:hypothetical protein